MATVDYFSYIDEPTLLNIFSRTRLSELHPTWQQLRLVCWRWYDVVALCQRQLISRRFLIPTVVNSAEAAQYLLSVGCSPMLMTNYNLDECPRQLFDLIIKYNRPMPSIFANMMKRHIDRAIITMRYHDSWPDYSENWFTHNECATTPLERLMTNVLDAIEADDEDTIIYLLTVLSTIDYNLFIDNRAVSLRECVSNIVVCLCVCDDNMLAKLIAKNKVTSKGPLLTYNPDLDGGFAHRRLSLAVGGKTPASIYVSQKHMFERVRDDNCVDPAKSRKLLLSVTVVTSSVSLS